MTDYQRFNLTYVGVTSMLTRAKDAILSQTIRAPMFYQHREASAWVAGYKYAIEEMNQEMNHQLRQESARQEAERDAQGND